MLKLRKTSQEFYVNICVALPLLNQGKKVSDCDNYIVWICYMVLINPISATLPSFLAGSILRRSWGIKL